MPDNEIVVHQYLFNIHVTINYIKNSKQYLAMMRGPIRLPNNMTTLLFFKIIVGVMELKCFPGSYYYAQIVLNQTYLCQLEW